MKASFHHLQVNIDIANAPFYKDLMAFLGWSVIHASDDGAGYRSDERVDMWFMKASKPEQSNSDQIGVSHIAVRVGKQSDVDETVTFLKKNNMAALFKTPRHRPEFAAEKNETYYQVMFESPDKILFEVVYIGPKS